MPAYPDEPVDHQTNNSEIEEEWADRTRTPPVRASEQPGEGEEQQQPGSHPRTRGPPHASLDVSANAGDDLPYRNRRRHRTL